MNALALLGARSLEVLRGFGHAAFFFVDLLRALPASLRRFELVVVQIHFIGNRSIVIIAASGLAVGFVLALQMYYALVTYGATESLGLIVNLALVRELGPVVAALLFAGRAGTALTSEIGLMKATDQLTAMQMMAVDPVRYVVVPRFLGGFIAMPLLNAIFCGIGLFGAQLIGVSLMGVDAGAFWSQTQNAVELNDVAEGIIKSIAFGTACSLIAVYEGFHAAPTAEGVGLATTRTVVTCSVLVLLIDYMLTAAFLNIS